MSVALKIREWEHQQRSRATFLSREQHLKRMALPASTVFSETYKGVPCN